MFLGENKFIDTKEERTRFRESIKPMYPLDKEGS